HVRTLLAVELQLRELFQAPTLARLAEHIEVLRRETNRVRLPPLVAQLRPERLPLSHGQERLWFRERLRRLGAAYNMPMARRLEGTLDHASLQLSLGELVRRHENLRTRFETVAGEAFQVVAPSGTFHLPVVDLSGHPEDERQREVHRLIQQEVTRGFD